MHDQDIRWKQRFQNFSRAFNLLRNALDSKDIGQYSDLELEGIVQRFEYTFELGWKTLKDYLEYSGVIVEEATPRKVIKACTSHGIFATAGINPDVYISMMLERNILSHVYDHRHFVQAINNIQAKHLHELDLQHKYFAAKELGNE